MRVLVTGGVGFIGSHIVRELLCAGDDVLVVDDLSTGKQINLPSGANFVNMSINDEGLKSVFKEFEPDAVSHCAAQSSVGVSMRDPMLDAQINILGGMNVLSATIEAKCPRFLYLNTGGALYGIPEYLPCDENHPVMPVSGYGLSKWILEQYIGLLSPKSVSCGVLRLANVYGPRQDFAGESGVVSIFGKRMLDNEPVTIFGDGNQTRDFIFVGDVVEAHRKVLNSDEAVTVNIGTGQPTSINELFRLVAAESSYNSLPLYQAGRPGEIDHIYLDISRAKRLLGWKPKTPLDVGINETLRWIRNQC